MLTDSMVRVLSADAWQYLVLMCNIITSHQRSGLLSAVLTLANG